MTNKYKVNYVWYDISWSEQEKSAPSWGKTPLYHADKPHTMAHTSHTQGLLTRWNFCGFSALLARPPTPRKSITLMGAEKSALKLHCHIQSRQMLNLHNGGRYYEYKRI